MTDNFDLSTLVEITLPKDDTFLVVKETLTRIGIGSVSKKNLHQSCHILRKRGKYYLIHFKELFGLDGKPSTFTDEDKGRRNAIANMLADWKLISLVEPEKTKFPIADRDKITVLNAQQKKEWVLVERYHIGSKKAKPVELSVSA